ncbi:PAF acetylhydrolase family protein [Metarhizium acridum CQMa 102]|uniref:PAF acetylhydrolase family protein n=1 Tax=Metarhizium acridum (strain CQMa 102) TaxID=655827 RepID=E9DXL7_METAQ|nr:PAF acetylhydrolase family protein [Metarhizium acridum CQMa 102]EFY91480.1 PAF acetylhydrolase family protein [Metarhizium acridum CQMa 102]
MKSIPCLTLLTAASAILVPSPSGPYHMRLQSITDPRRPADPLDPNDHGHGRRILFSIFLPVEKSGRPCPSITVPYMTPKVAADYGGQAAEVGLDDGLFSSFDMQLCDLVKLNPCGGGKGRRKRCEISRQPGPRGSHCRPPARSRFRRVPWALLDRFRLDLGKMAVFAHSVGGGAAATLARNDNRVLGGVDFDGQLVEAIRSQGLSRPFLLAGRYGHSAANSTDHTWNQFWPRLAGPRVELAIHGTAHASYTDRPLLVGALGLPGAVLDQFAGEIGSVKGTELEGIVDGVLASFFDFVLSSKTQRLVRLPRVYSAVLITCSNL